MAARPHAEDELPHPRESSDGGGDAAGPAPGPESAAAVAGPSPAIQRESGERTTATLPRIEGYDVQRQIGRGGSATVYLAREIKHDRQVALKVLHGALAASLQAERFLREIVIIARLAHPNILPLLDSGRHDGLLYYVTPYVPGESLRGRLERERRLAVDEAVNIAREAAEALDYAHRQGLVHRDVKPENILLADGHALVADFGIARAMSIAVDDRLTTTGLAPGTPRYMSPEQAGGAAEIDPRSDIYSLGCVVYEMLSGHPPFGGATPQEIAGKHLGAPVPSPRRFGAAVPEHLERVLRRALAKSPADRFATAGEFGRALAGGSGGHRTVSLRLPARRLVAALGIASVVAAGAWVAVRAGDAPRVLSWSQRMTLGLGLTRLNLDTAIYVVAPADSSHASAEAAEFIRNALARWREITVETDAQTRSAAGVDGPATERGLARAAITLRAARFVRVIARPAGDSIEVSAALHDARSGDRLTVRSLRTYDAAGVAGAAAGLADSLLFRGGVPAERSTGPAGTASLAARQWYFRGHAALDRGNFEEADSALGAALRADPDYPQALVWAANIRSWSGANRTEWLAHRASWQTLPDRALQRRSMLAQRDSLLLDALLALSAGSVDRACKLWTELTARAPLDFTAWYGLGSCLRRDELVVPDSRARTGWRFRSSYERTIAAFERAFQLRPTALRGFGGRSLARLRELMMTGSAQLRFGWSAAPDSQLFSGYPIWAGDTLELVPLAGASALAGPASDAMGEAIQRQRIRFRELARAWKGELPRSAIAVEAFAVALEMLGDQASLDTLRRARVLALDSEDRLRIAANEVLMRLKFSLPSNLAGVRAARALADTLLASNPVRRGAGPAMLAVIASLTGRADLAAAHARVAGGDASMPALLRDGAALQAFAALGGPRDSLVALEAVVQRAVSSLPASDQRSALLNWLMRPAVLAFPEVRLRVLPDSGETGLRAGNLVVAAYAGDSSRVRRILDEVARARRTLRPADKVIDALLPEALALVRIGDTTAAIDWIDPTLQSLPYVASQDLGYYARTGPLVRAMVLRADLAAGTGDRGAARSWARAVVALWSDADAFLEPVVARMSRLAR